MKKSLDNNALVSVIVPVYNQENFLKQCIESILFQEYENLEIILVNDGSTDTSLSMLKDFRLRDKRIVLVNKKNGGLSDARNVGIKIATGDFMCFVDADDCLRRDFVGKMLSVLERTGNSLACCRYTRSPFGKKAGNDITEFRTISSEEYLKNTLYQHDQSLYSVGAWAKMYRRSVYHNLNYPVGKLYEDFAIISDVLERVKEVCLVDEDLYYYRVTNNSITTSDFSLKRLDVLEHCDAILEKFAKNSRITKAAISMKFARTYEVLLSMKKSKYQNASLEKELWSYLKKSRKSIMADKEIRKEERLVAVLSFFGKCFILNIGILGQKIRGRK